MTDGQQFNTTIYLSVRQGVYNVQLLTFLRGGKNQDPNPSNKDSLAWIRCRGSTSLDSVTIPSVYESKFQVQLNSWYTCDIKVSDILDQTMNYRRKHVDIDCKHMGKIKLNLHTFTFANDNRTILGFIRWIPKFIANTPHNQTVIKELDNFRTVNQLNPIPLTTKRLEQSVRSKSTTRASPTAVGDGENDEVDPIVNWTSLSVGDDEADDNDDNTRSTVSGTNTGTWSLDDILNNDFEQQNERDDALLTTTASFTEPQVPTPSVNDFINDRTNQPPDRSEQIAIKNASEANNQTEQIEAALKAKNALEVEIEQVTAKLFTLQMQIDKQRTNANQYETESRETLNTACTMLKITQQQLNEKVEREKLINEAVRQISRVEYILPKSNQLILFKLNLLLENLRTLNFPQKEYFKDSIPIMEFHHQNHCTLILKGFPVHHQQLIIILKRLKDLFDRAQSAEDYYKLEINKNVQSLIRIIKRVRPTNSTHWKHYTDSLGKLIHQKCEAYIHKFTNYINDKLTSLLDDCIKNSSRQYQRDLASLTSDYMRDERFVDDVDSLKAAALDEFIRDHILLQQKLTKIVPTKESASTLSKHIEKIKKILTTNSSYKGCNLKQFQMIVPLLQRIMIYYHCFLLQLPLLNASINLLNRIENNTVLTIETSTGSGRSTLLPALLVAEGYDKIIVTQPRRLPCNLISQRVNSMVNDDISERLLNDENLITKNTTLSKYVIFFIDEVHERSINIDLCLALFARLLKMKPELKTKMKLIISSATLDASVPTLYRQISNCSLSEFSLISLSTLHTVDVNRVPNENILDLVQQLYSKRFRHDQILCFVGSTQEVHENCQLLQKITKGAIVAYPLIQSQSAIDQQKYIEQGTVFFSTTVAETSLTFPCLKYVIDTGVINMPVYSLELERTELRETKAAESTTKQRLGRLGRTQPGEYYALYDYKPGEQRKYPVPQICQSELMNIEFSLRKSRLKTSLKELKEYLPDKPDGTYIDDAIAQLQQLGLVSSSSTVLSALRTNRCGRDLIALSSILSVLNTSAILKSITAQYKRPEGDFMTLLKVMDTILFVRDSVPPEQFNVDRVCNAKGLSVVAHIIKQALRRYKNLERAFNLAVEFREDAQTQCGNWENIAKALLEGFSNKVYVSTKILQGKTQQFMKYSVERRASIQPQQSVDETSLTAFIDRSSTLRTGNKGSLPASLIVARDIRYLTAVRSSAILSFVGQLEPSWTEYTFTREFKLNAAEEQKLTSDNIIHKANQQFSQAQIHITNGKLVFRGTSGHILNAELYIRQQLVTELAFTLASDQSNNPNDNLTRNLMTITKMPIDLFGPLRWRWEAERQVKVRTKMNANKGTIDVKTEGLDSQNQVVRKEFMSFLSWLKSCAVIRDPHSGVSPRVLKPQIRDKFLDMEAKIKNITDPDRTSADRWKSLKGPTATRETRMEVVAWISVCEFYCRLEGGFVRDWVVGNYSSRPANLSPKEWIEIQQPGGMPILHKELIPSDLDCHLPALKQFDVEAFLDRLHGYDITAKVFRQDWRYVLLIDENYKTGPFTMDLIEPHIALTHDRIDFDVSNLSLERDFTRDLGMRVDITGGEHAIQLETIVENIRNKHFQVLRPIDGENGPNSSGTVAERIEKMKARGWTQIGKPLAFIPNPPSTYNVVLVPYPYSTTLYQNLVIEMKKISGAQVLSILQIKNPDIEALYQYMKRTISKECPGNDPNERELFHGTGGDAIDGIINRGFDDRYYSQSGAWGRGAYFADDPRKSNGYAPPDPTTRHRVIFYNKVLLGKESVQSTRDDKLGSAPLDHHSVHGIGGWTGFQYHEYIIYRYGQALPYLKITYTAP
ncbi:unnamed protein product [Didymodactylos carnosus]|uniref:Poly [ADP-ribose] polymerase n=1 Tax=Didymodactylos carnosus TaxID=1234261 RepID=A0A814S6M2_9BILA|nr:unnamed protein product [Didymodactylos carnosus]CAF1143976.1 unnamed protein product [Didymodactylos carnosus]CAF3716354.1 unnamed protein product [Didymodactylos carnosus]CAF3907640.1 unnamed protein product [Didymodactylos carnosus]